MNNHNLQNLPSEDPREPNPLPGSQGVPPNDGEVYPAPSSRSTQKPLMTYLLMGITIAVFLLQLVSQTILEYDLPVALGAKDNALIVSGQVWRLITPILLHASLIHIAFNMYALYALGSRIEQYFGPWRMLATYLISGFAGNVFSMMFTQEASIGSSPAIFGLLGAYGIFIYFNREIFGKRISNSTLTMIVVIAAINFALGMAPNVDNWGFVGGVLGGILFAWQGGPLLEVRVIRPVMIITDRRDSSDFYQAIAIVGGFFIFLAIGALYLMSQL